MAIKRPKSKQDYIINVADHLRLWADKQSSVVVDGSSITFHYHCGYGDIFTYEIEFRADGNIDLYGGFGETLYIDTYKRPYGILNYITRFE